VLRSAPDATKTEVRNAVEKLFKVKVEDVRTATFEGKLRRRGRYAGYRPDWKKAFVRLKAGQKTPEYAEMA
jgi:large subunit ribosomal protein L23